MKIEQTHRVAYEEAGTDFRMKLPGQLTDDGKLLKIFLAKDSHLRLDAIKQFGHHGRNTTKMSGTAMTFK